MLVKGATGRFREVSRLVEFWLPKCNTESTGQSRIHVGYNYKHPITGTSLLWHVYICILVYWLTDPNSAHLLHVYKPQKSPTFVYLNHRHSLALSTWIYPDPPWVITLRAQQIGLFKICSFNPFSSQKVFVIWFKIHFQLMLAICYIDQSLF